MSAPLEQGESYQYRFTVYDSSGAPADAATVTATITLPDGTPTSPTVTHSGLGLYDIDYTTVQTGRHVLLGDATGGVLASDHEKFEDVFNVEIPGRYLISLDDAITALRATATITTIADRQQLRWYILASSDAVERDLDLTICRHTLVEVYDGGKSAILLRHSPVISITTVVESGGTLPAGNFTLDTNAAVLHRGSTMAALIWIWGRQNVTITYVVGMVDVPPIVRKVCANGVQRMWQTEQQQPHQVLDAELAITEAIANLSPLERAAYDSLRGGGFA